MRGLSADSGERFRQRLFSVAVRRAAAARAASVSTIAAARLRRLCASSGMAALHRRTAQLSGDAPGGTPGDCPNSGTPRCGCRDENGTVPFGSAVWPAKANGFLVGQRQRTRQRPSLLGDGADLSGQRGLRFDPGEIGLRPGRRGRQPRLAQLEHGDRRVRIAGSTNGFNSSSQASSCAQAWLSASRCCAVQYASTVLSRRSGGTVRRHSARLIGRPWGLSRFSFDENGTVPFCARPCGPIPLHRPATQDHCQFLRLTRRPTSEPRPRTRAARSPTPRQRRRPPRGWACSPDA